VGDILLGGWLAYEFPDGAQNILALDDCSGSPKAPSPDDWWHDLMWAHWWRNSLADRWYAFDVEMGTAHEQVAMVRPGPRHPDGYPGSWPICLPRIWLPQ
jgi:hypothetical protein